MGLRIIGSSGFIENNLFQAQSNCDHGLKKLSISVKFLKKQTKTLKQLQSEKFLAKSQEFNKQKQNANNGALLTQFAETKLNNLCNIIIKLKEIVVQSVNLAFSDKERSFLFFEYQANYEDIINIAQDFFLKQGKIFNVLDKGNQQNNSEFYCDLESTIFATHIAVKEKLNKIKIFPQDLGILSVESLIGLREGVSIDDVFVCFNVKESNELMTIFDKAYLQLSEYQTYFLQINLGFKNFIQKIHVAYENNAAVRSQIIDFDYAVEFLNLVKDCS